jgi:signal peptidase
MGRAKHLLNRLLTAFVWIVAVACFGLLGFIGIGPHTGLYTTMTVLSGSMRPGIPVGAVVVGRPQPARDLRVGQVITYPIPVDDHRVVTHRVVRIISAGEHPVFQTKGDSNDAADPWVATATGPTVSRVRGVVPGLGYAIHWLRSRTLHMAGVVVLPVIVGVWRVVDIWREDDEPSPVVLEGVAAP